MTNGTPPTAPAPLERPRQGRVVAGVAVGIADRFSIEAVWVRLAFVFLAMFGGAGVLLYLVAWLLIPEEGESESILGAGVGDLQGLSGWLGIALIVFGGLIIFSWTGIVRPSVMWAGVLIIVGVILYRGELPQIGASKTTPTTDEGIYGRDPASTAATVETEPVPAAAATVTATTAEISTESGLSARQPDSIEALPPAPPPAPPRPKSVLGRLTLAVGLIAMGTMALLDTADVINPDFRHYLAVAVGIVGVGLLVGTLWGRSWGLIALGLILMPALLAATLVQVPLRGSFGDRTYRPQTVSAIPDVYELAAGSLKIDLRDVDLDDGPVVVTATVGFGELLVTVPAGAATTVEAKSGFGEVVIDGTTDGGVNVKRTSEWPGVGSIVIDVEVGFGSARIIRAER